MVDKSTDRIGEISTNNQGCLMKIISYTNSRNILVEFQDKYKYRVETRYDIFKTGGVYNPNFYKKRIGEIRENLEGCTMKIVEYNNSQDILVEFQDEYKSKVKTTYGNFTKRKIHNPCLHFGEIKKTQQGCLLKIIGKYNKGTKIEFLVEFQDEYKYITHCQYDTFLKGHIRNPYHLSICGIGCIGETSTNYNKKTKRSYVTWKHMIERCYSENERYKNKSYYNCSVNTEWLCFANFEKWYESNYYEVKNEKMHIDKDILKRGNREYSSNNCVIVPQTLNNVFRYPHIITKDNNILEGYKKCIPQHTYDKIYNALINEWGCDL